VIDNKRQTDPYRAYWRRQHSQPAPEGRENRVGSTIFVFRSTMVLKRSGCSSLATVETETRDWTHDIRLGTGSCDECRSMGDAYSSSMDSALGGRFPMVAGSWCMTYVDSVDRNEAG
jgi:hypothetical protein